MAEFIGRSSCDHCGSKDNGAIYDDGGFHCFGCGFTIPSEEYKKDKGSGFKKSRPRVIKAVEKETVVSKVLSEEDKTHVKTYGGFKAGNFRGIHDDTLKFFGCRTELSEENEVKIRYYPITREDQLVGYKVREIPKKFSTWGDVSGTVDLYGAFRFRNGGKYILIVGGEEDAHAAYQMFKEYADSKGSDFVTAVVSVTTGETSAQKQIAANYEFLNSFDQIIIGFDNDDAGKEGTDKIISSLPKGKIKIATWTKGKDPNEILMKGQHRSFIQDFYAAKQYVPAGVLSSDSLYEKIIEQAMLQKVPMPPFLTKLGSMMGGGLALGHIMNVAALTSIGKTSIVNEMIYYWIFNSPHLIGVVSMELNSGQYGETLLSRHIEQKLARLSNEDKLNTLNSEYVRKKGQELFVKEDGSPRFYLVDDRDGTVEQIQNVIEQMIISSGVKIIVIDPLQDLIEGMSNEEQGLFMKWCKSIIKSHTVSFVLINHMRKKQGGDDSIRVSESDIMGSSTIAKSASYNVLLARDKDAEDPIERNTTYVTMPKSRLIGETGSAGKIYYDNLTHVMHDFDEYWSNPSIEKPVKVEPADASPEKEIPFGTDFDAGFVSEIPNSQDAPPVDF